MATKVIENSNTRLFGLIFFGKMASIYSANGPKPLRMPDDWKFEIFRRSYCNYS